MRGQVVFSSVFALLPLLHSEALVQALGSRLCAACFEMVAKVQPLGGKPKIVKKRLVRTDVQHLITLTTLPRCCAGAVLAKPVGRVVCALNACNRSLCKTDMHLRMGVRVAATFATFVARLSGWTGRRLHRASPSLAPVLHTPCAVLHALTLHFVFTVRRPAGAARKASTRAAGGSSRAPR